MSDSTTYTNSTINHTIPKYTLDATLKRARVETPAGSGNYVLKTADQRLAEALVERDNKTYLQTTSDIAVDLSNTTLQAAVDLTPVTNKQTEIIDSIKSTNNGTVLSQVIEVKGKIDTTNSKLDGINNLLI